MRPGHWQPTKRLSIGEWQERERMGEGEQRDRAHPEPMLRKMQW